MRTTNNVKMTFNVRLDDITGNALLKIICDYLWNIDGVDRVMSETVMDSGPCESDCPGLECSYAWHTGGCEPFWQYSKDGYVLSGGGYDEDDADERSLWSGPDGPDRVEYRRNGRWEEA